jgi:hypothetical protein
MRSIDKRIKFIVERNEISNILWIINFNPSNDAPKKDEMNKLPLYYTKYSVNIY